MWDGAENQIEILMIRHGCTRENQLGKYLGRTDSGISAEGEQALKQRVDNACYQEVDLLFVSPMRRCVESANIMYPKEPQHVIADFIEMDFGKFEGKNYLELQGNLEYQRWMDSNGTLPFPKGESREAFVERTTHGYFQMLQEISEKNVFRVGLVAHGGTIMALLSGFYGGSYFDYQVKNGQGYRCLCQRETGIIQRITKIE